MKLEKIKNRILKFLSKTQDPPEEIQEDDCVSFIDELKARQSPATLNELKDFIKRWNATYPIDRWWREKYKVPINSERHRNTFIIDMRLEYEEDILWNQLRSDRIKSLQVEKYEPGRGEWLKKRELYKRPSKEQVDDMFNNLDVGAIESGDTEKEIII